MESAIGGQGQITIKPENKDNLVISRLNFYNGISQDLELTKPEDGEAFYKKLELDSDYNLCEVSHKSAVYEEEFTIGKAKADDKKNKVSSDINMDIDVNGENKQVIDDNIYTIENVFSMVNKTGDNSKINIPSDATELKIPSDVNPLVLKVTIEQNATISITDTDGKDYINPISNKLSTDSSQVNHLNLHFNFKNYLLGSKDALKDVQINVYNEIADTNKVVANLYIEKSIDLNVIANSKKGKFNRYKREDNKDIVKIGPLYNIQVKIGLIKGNYNKDTKKYEPITLFTGHTNKNIDIK